MAAQSLLVKKALVKAGGSVGSYAELEKKVKERFALAQMVIEQEKVSAYWDVGKWIDEHITGQGERAGYGKQVVKKLAHNIGISRPLLYKILQFPRMFPIVSTSRQLEWSHYVTLFSVKKRTTGRCF